MTDPDAAREPAGSFAPVGLSAPPPGAEPPHAAITAATVADLRMSAWVAGILIVVGAALGPLWAWWSGPQQRAYVLAPGTLFPFDEVETMAAADGRYLAIVAAVGLVTPVALWFARPASRGAVAVIAMALGGLAGAALTAWFGHLAGGGNSDGKPGTTIAHLPLSLHMHGLLFVEPALTTLIYGLFVAFAARDDLGRPDPVRERASVGGDHDAQDRGRDGD